MARARFRSLLAFAFFFAAAALTPQAKTSGTPWQSGRIVSVEVYGQGEKHVKGTGNTKPVHKRKDFWWAYCIGAGKRSYSAALRRSPSRSGLKVNEPVMFFTSRDRLYVLSPQGKRYEMRILRQDDGDCCRQ